MALQKKTIGRMPTDHGPYDLQMAYGKKYQCTLFGCVWESLHDNNSTAPAEWDGGDTITPNTVDWKKLSGDYEAWLMNQDKPAKSEEYPYNGMGRVRLKKNIVNGVNTLTQSMINKSNTIYVIQYDFTLGEDITVPENCVLDFEGGSLSGAYTLTGNSTGINARLVKIFNTDITLAGSWNVVEAYPEWFGVNYASMEVAINKCISSFNKSTIVNPGTLTNSINLSSDSIIDGNGKTLFYSGNGSAIIISDDSSNVQIQNIEIHKTNTEYSTDTNCIGILCLGRLYNLCVNNVVLRNYYYGIKFEGLVWESTIKKCRVGRCVVGISIINALNNLFEQCYFDNPQSVGIKISGDNIAEQTFLNCNFGTDGSTGQFVRIDGASKNNVFRSCNFETVDISISGQGFQFTGSGHTSFYDCYIHDVRIGSGEANVPAIFYITNHNVYINKLTFAILATNTKIFKLRENAYLLLDSITESGTIYKWPNTNPTVKRISAIDI